MSEIRLTADESDVIKALDNIEKKLVEAGQQAKSTGKVIGEALTDSGEDAKRAAVALGEYRAAQERIALSTGDRLQRNKEMQESLKKNREAQEAANKATDMGAKKNIDMSKSVKVNSDAVKNQGDASKRAAGSAGGLSAAISATPWGRIAVAIGGVITFLSKFQEGMDLVEKVTASVSAVMTVLVQRLVSAGKALFAFISGDFASLAKNAKEASDGFVDAVTNAATSAFALVGRIQALRDAQLDAAIGTAKLTAASEKQQAIAQQEVKTFDERISALRAAISLEAEISKRRTGFAEQDASIARQAFAISAKGVSDKELLNVKELAAIAARSDGDKKRIELLGQLNEIEKARADFIVKNLEDVDKIVQKLNANLQTDPIESELVAVRQKYEGLTRLAEEALLKLVEVEKLRPLNSDELKKRQDLQNAIVDITEQAADAEIAALLEGIKKANALEEAKLKEKEDINKKDIDSQRAHLRNILELQNQEIDITQAEFDNVISILRAGGAKEEDIKEAQNQFDRRIKSERIEAEIQYQKAILSLSGNGIEAQIIRARIQELETVLDGLNIPDPQGRKPRTLLEIAGINVGDPTEEDAIRAAIESVQIIMDSIGSLAQARLDDAEAAARAAQDKVEAAQDALDKEKEIAEQGLANFVDIRQKDLDNAKQQRDKALKEERDARKAQIALDTVSQSVGLITSSVNIFKALSFFGPIGVALAVTTIGVMFAAFAKVKSDALKAASIPKLRSGKRFDGATHEQGGEDMVHDGKRAYKVEKGEWLIGTSHSKEHNTFLANLNGGKYQGYNLLSMAEGRRDTARNMGASASRTESLRTRRENVGERQHLNALAGIYEVVGDRIVRAIEEKPESYPWKDGYVKVTKKGSNVTRKTVTPAG